MDNWWTIASIIAVLLSPLIALNVQKMIEISQDKRKRKLWIFYTLMATRANRLSYNHVEALNSIDLEYYQEGKNGKKVLDAWQEYLSLLGKAGHLTKER